MIKKDMSGLLPADQLQVQFPISLTKVIGNLNTTHQFANSEGGKYD